MVLGQIYGQSNIGAARCSSLGRLLICICYYCHQAQLLLVLLSAHLATFTTRAFGLLGAGEGRGSCPAPPYRAAQVAWPHGCPAAASCCNEYGYCGTEADWAARRFRDCNGESNGRALPEDVLKLEASATKSSI